MRATFSTSTLFLLALIQVINACRTYPQHARTDCMRTRLVATMLDSIDELSICTVPITVAMEESGWRTVKGGRPILLLPVNIKPALIIDGLSFEYVLETLNDLGIRQVITYGAGYSREELAAFEREGLTVILGMFGPGSEGDSKTNTVTHFFNYQNLSDLGNVIRMLKSNTAYFI